MKKLILFISVVFLCATVTINAQNVAINKDGSNPHTSAMLDVSASDAGILIPRMSEAQRNSITSPARGLLIYQTDQFPGFRYYTGTIWTPIYNSLYPYVKEVQSTDSLLCTVSYLMIPGLLDTVELLADAKVIIEVTGAIEVNSNDKKKYASAEIAIFEDGSKLTHGGFTRIYANNDEHSKSLRNYSNYNLKSIRTLSAGTYVFDIRARRYNTGGESKQPIAGGNSASPRATSMSVIIIYE